MENIYNPFGNDALDFRVNRNSFGRDRYYRKAGSTTSFAGNCIHKVTTFLFERVGMFSVIYAYICATNTNSNGGNTAMVSQRKGISPTIEKKVVRTSGNSSDANGYKLHLAMDKESYARLVWLVGALQAASFGEVLRRALAARDIFDPIDLPETTSKKSDQNTSPVSSEDIKHLYIVIPKRMKDNLDSEKSENGTSYADTIRCALRVLTQLVREREKLVNSLSKGPMYENKKQNTIINKIDPMLLASV